MNVGELVVRFAADVANFTAGAQQVNDSVQKTAGAAQTHISGSFVASMQKGWGSILEFGAHAYQTFLGVQQAIQTVTGVVGGWIQSAEDAAANQAVLNARLLSTHDAVGMTANQINQMVQNLKNLNGVDDDAILKGTNMLLTFTSIGKDVFPQANQAMIDLAYSYAKATGTSVDMTGQAVMLGKALNDPLNGITALGKEGVKFSDAQKEQIKQWVQMGDITDAQKLILNEINREMGGTAAAMTNTDPFTRFNLAMGDIGKAIGGILLPPLTALANMITPLANDFLGWISHLGDAGGAFSQLGSIWNNVILPPLQEIGRIINVDTKPGLDAIGDAASKIIAPFQHLSDIHVNWRPVLNEINNLVWEGTQAFDALAGGVDAVVSGLTKGTGPFSFLQGVARDVADDLSKVGQALTPLGGMFDDLGNKLASGSFASFAHTLADWGPIVQQAAGWFQSSMMPAILQVIPPVENLVNIIITQGVPAFFTIRDTISHVASVFATTLLPVIERVAPIVLKLGGYIADLAGKALAFLIPKIQQAVQAVGDFASGIATRLQPFIDRLASGIQIAAQIIQVVWGYVWPYASAVLKTFVDLAINLITPFWDLLKFLFNAGADILSGNWGQLWKDLKDFISHFTSDVHNIATGLWNDVKGVFNAGKDDITSIWSSIWNGLSGVVSSAWDGVKSVVAGGINGAIDLINKLIDAADKVPGVNISHIPHVSFASGGVMGQTGLAMVGERGPELMMLPGGARIFNNDFVQQLADLANTLSGGSAGSSASIQAAGLPQVQQGGGINAYPGSSGQSATPIVQENYFDVSVYMDGQKVTNVVMTKAVAALRNAGVRV